MDWYKISGVWAEDNPPGLTINHHHDNRTKTRGNSSLICQCLLPLKIHRRYSMTFKMALTTYLDHMPVILKHPTLGQYIDQEIMNMEQYRICVMWVRPLTPFPQQSTLYTLMRVISANVAWFTSLDLKDAFSCLCFALVIQHNLYHLLWKTGYKVSRKKKAQICQQEVKYLALQCSWILQLDTRGAPTGHQVETVCTHLILFSWQQIGEFRGQQDFVTFGS